MDRNFASHSTIFLYDLKVNYPGNPRKDLNLEPIILDFREPEATDVGVDGRAKQSSPDKEINGYAHYKDYVPTFVMNPGDNLKIVWNNEGEREQRDVDLAIIGVLLGMVGATIIEIVKLFLPRE